MIHRTILWKKNDGLKVIRSILWLTNIPSCVCIYHSFLIHSSVNGHLCCFHVLAIVNSVANTGAHASLSVKVFSGYMPNGGIVASYGNSIPIFLSSIHNVLHSDSINLHSHHGVSKVFKGSSTLILNFQ